MKDFTFTIYGVLNLDCTDLPAANKTLELFVAYNTDTVRVITQTNAGGLFNLSYTENLPETFPHYGHPLMVSYAILTVKEDSVSYFLEAMTNYKSLNLHLKDSINLNIYVDFLNNPLKATDTLYYGFESPEYFHPAKYVYKIGGPVSNHTLINQIHTNWDKVEIDLMGNVHFKMYSFVRHENQTLSSVYPAEGSKKFCVMRQDSLVIQIP